MTLATETSVTEELAIQFAADMLHRALLNAGAPVKVSEAARLLGRPDVDMRLARVVLTSSMDRFAAADRKWTVRFQSTKASHPTERTVEEVLESCGEPVQIDALVAAVASVQNRPAEACTEVVSRLVTNGDRFYRVGEEAYGRRCWLLDVQSDEADDVLFDNFLTDDDIAAYPAGVAPVAGDASSVAQFLDAVGRPVPGKVLQFLAWRASPGSFNPEKLIGSLLEAGAFCLSSREWIGPDVASRLAGLFPTLAERAVADDAETRAAEVAEPLIIRDEEREQLVEAVLGQDTTSRVEQMLEDIFEVARGEPTYEADHATVLNCLREDPRIVWIGADRFLPQGAIPDYVFTVPDILRFPDVRYLDMEGNEIDYLLEDDGLSGGLLAEVLTPVAQDCLDEEPTLTPDGSPPNTVRCVLKFHHKEIGTFPLAQLPPGFFPTDAPIVQVEMTLPNGHKVNAWVNNGTRLVYGLLDWYTTVPIDSGAVFYMERQSPDRYVLTCGEETEPALFVSRNRVNDLLELGRRAEAEELPTFEVVRDIMEHYRKGIEFITVLTEVNIARRTTRRAIASLLSAYHCFYQRNRVWVFDARKLSQGLDKSKRKYLLNR